MEAQDLEGIILGNPMQTEVPIRLEMTQRSICLKECWMSEVAPFINPGDLTYETIYVDYLDSVEDVIGETHSSIS
jgi:hypothetical protein